MKQRLYPFITLSRWTGLYPRIRTLRVFAAYIVACGLNASCGYSEPPPRSSPVFAEPSESLSGLRFGIIPLHNPVRLYSDYLPLIDLLNTNWALLKKEKGITDINTIKPETAKDYPSFEAKLTARELDFALINPYQIAIALKHGYRLFGKIGGNDLRGIIVARSDSRIKHISDLRGQVISFPAPTAFAATMLNKVYLKKNGLNVEQDSRIKYVNSQNSAIMNVYFRLSKAGGTWPPMWKALQNEHPEIAAELEIVSQTESMPSLALMVRDDIHPAIHKVVSGTLFKLHEHAVGKKILFDLGVPRFERATLGHYKAIWSFLDTYKNMFGALVEAKTGSK